MLVELKKYVYVYVKKTIIVWPPPHQNPGGLSGLFCVFVCKKNHHWVVVCMTKNPSLCGHPPPQPKSPEQRFLTLKLALLLKEIDQSRIQLSYGSRIKTSKKFNGPMKCKDFAVSSHIACQDTQFQATLCSYALNSIMRKNYALKTKF